MIAAEPESGELRLNTGPDQAEISCRRRLCVRVLGVDQEAAPVPDADAPAVHGYGQLESFLRIQICRAFIQHLPRAAAEEQQAAVFADAERIAALERRVGGICFTEAESCPHALVAVHRIAELYGEIDPAVAQRLAVQRAHGRCVCPCAGIGIPSIPHGPLRSGCSISIPCVVVSIGEIVPEKLDRDRLCGFARQQIQKRLMRGRRRGTLSCIQRCAADELTGHLLCGLRVLCAELGEQLIVLQTVELRLIADAGEHVIVGNVRPHQPFVARLFVVHRVLEAPVGIAPVEIARRADLVGIPRNEPRFDQMIRDKAVEIVALRADAGVIPKLPALAALLLIIRLVFFIGIKHRAERCRFRHLCCETIVGLIAERLGVNLADRAVVPVGGHILRADMRLVQRGDIELVQKQWVALGHVAAQGAEHRFQVFLRLRVDGLRCLIGIDRLQDADKLPIAAVLQHIQLHLVVRAADDLAVAGQIDVLHCACILKEVYHPVEVLPVEKILSGRHFAVCAGHIRFAAVAAEKRTFRHQERFRVHKDHVVPVNGQIPRKTLHDAPPVLVEKLHIILIRHRRFQRAEVRTSCGKPVYHFKARFVRIRNRHSVDLHGEWKLLGAFTGRYAQATGIDAGGLSLWDIYAHPIRLRRIFRNVQWCIGKQRVRIQIAAIRRAFHITDHAASGCGILAVDRNVGGVQRCPVRFRKVCRLHREAGQRCTAADKNLRRFVFVSCGIQLDFLRRLLWHARAGKGAIRRILHPHVHHCLLRLLRLRGSGPFRVCGNASEQRRGEEAA